MTVGSQVKQTLSSLKGAQATLRIYAAQTRDEETRAVYEEALASTGEIIKDLEERLHKLEFQEPQYKGN
jgi:bacterioferritin (cytochrome b1)